MDFRSLLENFVLDIMDGLEEFVSTVTIASGKKLIQILYVLLGFLAFSVVMLFLKLPVFVTWDEALTAVVIMGIVCCINCINKARIKDVKDKILGRR